MVLPVEVPEGAHACSSPAVFAPFMNGPPAASMQGASSQFGQVGTSLLTCRPEKGSGRDHMRPSMEWGMARIAEGAVALQYVHNMGRVHNDIKPGNLTLDADERLVILDWGSSFLTSEPPRTWW